MNINGRDLTAEEIIALAFSKPPEVKPEPEPEYDFRKPPEPEEPSKDKGFDML